MHGNTGRHKQHHQSLLEVEKKKRRRGGRREERGLVGGRLSGGDDVFLPIILSQLQTNITIITEMSN